MNENCTHKLKNKKRSKEDIKKLNSRINRIIGQLSGVCKMFEENRYCGEILIQLNASISALKKIEEIVLKEHINTCVVEDLKNEKYETVDELIKLIEEMK